MMKRFATLGERRHSTPDLLWCGSRILAVLALVLACAGLMPSPAAHAAPAGEPVQFDLMAVPAAEYVCVNESMTFRVYVTRSIGSESIGGPSIGRISGVPVEATVVTPNMGTIAPAALVTGFSMLEPAEVEFTFTAGKDPGTATVGFTGRINKFWASGGGIENSGKPVYASKSAEVEVRNCDYKVSVFFMETVPGTMTWTGTADEIQLKRDSGTHFSGSTGFEYSQWLLSQPPRCPFAITVEPTKIDYQADLVEDTLHLTVVIHDTTNKITNGCIAQAGIGQLGERRADVSFPSAGGSIVYPQPPYATFIISVTQVVGE